MRLLSLRSIAATLRGALQLEASPIAWPWFKGHDPGRLQGRLRRAAAAWWWESAGLDTRRRVELWLAGILWPGVAVARAVTNVRRSGGHVARDHGVPRWRQLVDQLYLANRWNVTPRTYYQHRLFEGRHRLDDLLLTHELALLLSRLGHGRDLGEIDDKARFLARCRAHGLPAPETYASTSSGAVRWRDVDGPDDVPRVSLVLKPTSLSGGRGFERWAWDEVAGRWSRGGLLLDLDGLLSRARAQPYPVLVQRALENHPELRPIAPDAVCTVRAVTGREPGRAPTLLWAVLRVPAPGREVDNVGQGGAAAPIDVARGVLAGARPDAVELGTWDLHPVTGAPIAGRRVPRWSEVVATVLLAHSTVDLAFVGWDVALTPDGPLLLEGNTVLGGAEDAGPGLAGTAFAACAAAHLEGRARRSAPETGSSAEW